MSISARDPLDTSDSASPSDSSSKQIELSIVLNVYIFRVLSFDLKRESRRSPRQALSLLFFYLPPAALKTIADGANAPRFGDVSYKRGASVKRHREAVT
jgi:hypothetical protein